MTFVVDASVGIKWVLREADSPQALALLRSGENLKLPDFWLNEAANALWSQVRRRLLAEREACDGLRFLRAIAEPIPTGAMRLHEAALDIGLRIDHSIYDTLYLAFGLAIGADALILADQRFEANVTARGDARLKAMMLPLDVWAARR